MKKLKLELLSLSLIVIFITLVTISNQGAQILNTSQSRDLDNQLQSATGGSGSVSYGGWGYCYTTTTAPAGIISTWAFSGSNPNVGIYVMAMDSTNYNQFSNRNSYTYYPLSDGSYYSSSGTFTTPYSAQWYIVFYNNCSVMETTTLTYSMGNPNVPNAPTSLSATYSSSDYVTLTWSASSNNGGSLITGYNVYRGTSSSNEVLIGTVTSTGCQDSNILADTTYYYTVTAVNSAGESLQSNQVSVAVPTERPTAPQSLIATYSKSGFISLSWTAPYNGGSAITGYNVYRGTSSGSEVKVGSVTSTGCIDYGIYAGQTFYYTVTAVNSIGESAQSNENFATVPYTGPIIYNTTTTVSTLSYSDYEFTVPSGAVNINVHLYFKATGGSGNDIKTSIYDQANFAAWQSGGSYTYIYYSGQVTSANVVFPLSDSGNYYLLFDNQFSLTSSKSVQGNVYLTYVTKPAAPTGLTITPNPTTDGTVNLQWQASSGATSYTVYMYNSFINSVNSSLTNIGTFSSTNCTDNLTSAGTYYYAVVASNIAGNSSLSICQSVAYVEKPEAPTGLTITPNPSTDGNINLQWQASSGATSYTVYRSNSLISSLASSLTVVGTFSTTTCNDTLTSNGTYYYVVVASNIAGDSSISNCQSVVVSINGTKNNNNNSNPNPSNSSPGYNLITLGIAVAIGGLVLLKRLHKKL